jgi:uncharacterized repeat protein (TIGR04138 family)
MTFFNTKLAEVDKRDPRFSYEAYEFVFQPLHHTQRLLGREPLTDQDVDPAHAKAHHVSGPELRHGIRALALQEFGLMARTVFHMWGITKTDDFGDMVFNLVEAELMSKTPQDTRNDFHNVYDLDEALLRDFHIQLDEVR